MKKVPSGGGLGAAVMVLALAVSASAGESTPTSRTFGAVSCAAAPASTAVVRPVKLPLAQSSPRERVRKAAQVTRNEKADLTFELRPSADGGAEVIATSGDLRITKTVQSTGEFTLQIATGRDTASVAANGRGTTVTRGRQKVELPKSNGPSSRLSEARKLLSDSEATLRFRSAADALIAAEDRSPAALAIIISDATIGMLTGDVGATRRIAKYLAGRAASNLRPVGMALDCFALMEQRMVEAWDDYMSCYVSVSTNWLATYYEEMCAARWVVQVESYWFGFLSCSGFSW